MVWFSSSSSLLVRFFLAGVLLTTASCSGRKPVFPVEGKVLMNGQPTPGATVIFHPKDATDKEALFPTGKVNMDGTFLLTTYDAYDGAPAGPYTVTVSWLEAPTVGDDDGKLLVNRRYLSPTTSGLSAEVRAGTNELPPFKLSP